MDIIQATKLRRKDAWILMKVGDKVLRLIIKRHCFQNFKSIYDANLILTNICLHKPLTLHIIEWNQFFFKIGAILRNCDEMWDSTDHIFFQKPKNWNLQGKVLYHWETFPCHNWCDCWSQWPRGLRRRSTAARLLRLWVRIPPGAWMFACYECCMLSGRGLCDGLIIRSEESYRLCRVVVCDQVTSYARRLKPARGL